MTNVVAHDCIGIIQKWAQDVEWANVFLYNLKKQNI